MERRGLLLLIRGFPGCGKSTLARNLLRTPIGSKFVNLDPDAVRVARLDRRSLLNFEGEQIPEATLIYRFLLKRAKEELFCGINVLWDQPWRSLWGIRVTRNKLEESLGYFELVILELFLPVSVAKQRMRKRISAGGHGPTDETFDRMVCEFEYAPTDEFRVVQLNALTDPHTLTRMIVEILKKEL